MSKPYFWDDNERAEKDILVYNWKERKTDKYTFMEGHFLPFDSGNPNLSYTLKDPKDYDLIYESQIYPDVFLDRYDVFVNNATAPLVNTRVKDILEALCQKDVQFFPVTIRNDPEKKKMTPFENHDYWLLNITQLADNLDREKSVFQTKDYLGGNNKPKITNLKKVVLDPMPDGVHIARLIDFLPYILVSEELVKIFKREKIKGVKFVTEDNLFL